LTSEELILRNTFVNARMGPLADFRVSKVMKKNRKIKWIDEHEPKRGNMNKKDALRTN
jgi:hypothetical protein